MVKTCCHMLGKASPLVKFPQQERPVIGGLGRAVEFTYSSAFAEASETRACYWYSLSSRRYDEIVMYKAMLKQHLPKAKIPTIKPRCAMRANAMRWQVYQVEFAEAERQPTM